MTSSRQSWAYRRALPQAHPGPSVFYTSVRSVSALIAGLKFSLFLPNKAIYRAISFSAAAALRIRTAGGWARLYAAAVEATLAGVGFAPEITEEILLTARPVGALEITEAGTRFIPFIDPARLAIALALGSLISLAIVADVRV